MIRESTAHSITHTHNPPIHTHKQIICAYSHEKKREVLKVTSAATKRQEQALTRERRGDSLAISKEGAMVFTSICSLYG